jgi:hypothetical protein
MLGRITLYLKGVQSLVVIVVHQVNGEDLVVEAQEAVTSSDFPKEAKARGGLIHHSTRPESPLRRSSTPLTNTMSVALPLRRFPGRIAQPWICTACSRSLSRLPRTRSPAFPAARRWLNTTEETRQGVTPSMDQMHARYKQKNRTVMYVWEALRQKTVADRTQGTMYLVSS